MIFAEPFTSPDELPRFVVKDTPVHTLTIRFTKHRTHPVSRQATYAWGHGQVRKSISADVTPEVVARILEKALRVTPHWDEASKIEIEIVDCTYTECLCAILGINEPG